MASKTDSVVQGLRATRMVWGVIAVGLGAGSIMLAAFAFSIYRAHSNETAINAVSTDLDHILSTVNERLVRSQRETSILLSGRKPDQSTADASATLPATSELSSGTIGSEVTRECLDKLYAAMQDVKNCRDQARQWLDRNDNAERAAGPVGQRVDVAVAHMREFLERSAGRERLQRAIQIRKFRADGKAADPKVGQTLIESSLGNESLSMAQKELADLVLLIERLRSTPDADQLTDLKDNQIHPALARLRRQMSRLEATSVTPTTSNLKLIDELMAAVFGDGSWSDDDHQTIQLGEHGLFRSCQRRLELARECRDLQDRMLTVITAAESVKHQLSQLNRTRMQMLAAESTNGFEHAWWSTLAVALVCGLLFLSLSIKTGRILRGQFLEIIAATNSARASEQRVRQVINATFDAVITVDEYGVINGWNARAEQILGWKTEEVMRKLLAETILPEGTRQDFWRWIHEYLDTGRESGFNQRIETRAVRRDGTQIAVDLAIVPLRSGTRVEFNLFLQDITQRKQKEYTFTRILAESTSLAEAAPRILEEICSLHKWELGSFWLVDPKADVVRCLDTWRNPAAARQAFETATRDSTFSLGEELPGRAWLDHHWICVADLSEESVLQPAREGARGNLCSIIEFPIMVDDNVLGIIEIAGTTVREADEETLLTLSAIGSRLGHFIERQQADEALRLAEAKSRSLLNAIPDIMIQLNDARSIVDLRVSPSEADIYSSELMLGKPLAEVFPDGAARLILSSVDAATGTGRVQNVEYELIDRTNKTRNYEARVAPMGDSGCLLLTRDVSDRKRMQSQLAQAKKLESIGQLAAGIAHEINTPIQYIGDNTRFLQDNFACVGRLLREYEELLGAAKTDSLTSERLAAAESTFRQAEVPFLIDEIPSAIEQSLEGVDRVAVIVRAMKNFSHPDGEQKQLTDLNHCVENTVLVARNEWKYLAEVATDLDPQLPQVLCLAGEFNQVILNLIVNAAHAIGDVTTRDPHHKGVIRISSCRRDDWVEIRVGDNGAGIPESVRDRVFDPFFTTKEIGRGTGQGLAIAYSVIVERHGGTISFETEIGRGTTFIIRLPLAGTSAKHEPAELAEAIR